MTEPRTIAEHGRRTIAALERAWAAIQDQHPYVPDVVIVTGAGSNQKGTPERYRLRGHHWFGRWVLDGQDKERAPELFIAGSCCRPGAGPSWRSCCTRPHTPWPPGTATTTSGSPPWRPSWGGFVRTEGSRARSSSRRWARARTRRRSRRFMRGRLRCGPPRILVAGHERHSIGVHTIKGGAPVERAAPPPRGRSGGQSRTGQASIKCGEVVWALSDYPPRLVTIG